MNSDARAVEAMMPNAGTPRRLSRPNASGKSPSLAAASGISAQIMVQPFNAPKPEMTTRADITYPAHVPPKIELTAVANGAVDSDSVVADTMPNTAVSDSRYTTAVPRVPKIVARGTFLSGLRTLAAATAAVSTPR